jgi:small redox-active disulfide protein 2
MQIEIFSTNCVKCRRLEFNLQQAITELGIEAVVTKVSDIAEMERRGIKSVPALAIDGEIRIIGLVPRVSDLKELIMGRTGPFD